MNGFRYALLILGASVSISVSRADEFAPAATTLFFHQNRQDLPEEFRQALNGTGSEHALKTDEYPFVVSVFTWWMRDILKDECIPSDAFISKNLQLFPAAAIGTEDRAVLSYRKGVNNYLIVQTGGPSGRLYIFIRGNDVSAKMRDQDAQRFILDILSQHIKVPSDAEMPEIQIHEQSKLHLVMVGPPHVKRNLQHSLKGVFADGEVALSLSKQLFERGAGRAWLPAPNRWFETEKKAQDEQAEVEKAQAILHSPDNLEKERQALEKEFGLTNATRLSPDNTNTPASGPADWSHRQ